MGRNLKTRLDLLKPDVKRRVDKKLFTNETKSMKVFNVGDKVWARNFTGGVKWVPGKVIKQLGPVLYHVSAKGMVWKRHADQLRTRVATDRDVGEAETVSCILPPPDSTVTVPATNVTTGEQEQAQVEVAPKEQDAPATAEAPIVPEETPPALKTTRSGRTVRTPSRFKDFEL